MNDFAELGQKLCFKVQAFFMRDVQFHHPLESNSIHVQQKLDGWEPIGPSVEAQSGEPVADVRCWAFAA